MKPVDILFPEATKLIAEGKCPMCKTEDLVFRNTKSVDEYRISGLCQCQKCQDSVFGKD